MPEQGSIAAIDALRKRKKAIAEYDGMLERLSPQLQRRIEKAGQRWWVKPSVLVDLIEHAKSDEDFDLVGGLAAKVENRKVHRSYERAVALAAEQERKRRDRGFQWDDVTDVGKGVIRSGFSALESGGQEVQGLFRSITAGMNVPVGGTGLSRNVAGVEGEGFVGSQSSMGITIEKLFSGDISPGEVLFGDPDAGGRGFFPEGNVREEQRSRAWRSAHIGNQSLTPGRLVSSMVSEPGDWAHRWISGSIDGGIMAVADPGDKIGSAIGAAVKARRYFNAEETKKALGLVRGQRRTITDAVEEWLPSSEGRKFINYLTKTSDPGEIWESSRREIPIEWAVKLADESDPRAVEDLARGFLGTEMNVKPKGWHYSDHGVKVRHFTLNAPLFGNMPRSGLLDTFDSRAFVTQVADELKNAHVPLEQRRALVNKAMRAMTSGPPGQPLASERFSVLTAVKEATTAQLRAAGVKADKAKDLNRIWNSYEKLRAYNVDTLTGHEVPLPNQVAVGGRTVPSAAPHTIEQLMSRFVPMADMRTLREISQRTSRIAALEAKGAHYGQRIADLGVYSGVVMDAMSNVWKPLQLMRLAYAPRVVGDEQARIASAGMASLFSSPLTHLSIAIMDDGRLGKLLTQAGVTVGRGNADVLGRKLATGKGGRLEGVDEDLEQTLYQGISDLLFGEKTRRAPGFISINRTEPGFLNAWADEVKFLYDNQIARRIARGESLEDIKEWYWGSGYRAAAIGGGDVQRFAGDEAGTTAAERLSPLAAQVATREGSDRYVDHMLDWVEKVTQGQDELVHAVATGRLPDSARTHSARGGKYSYANGPGVPGKPSSGTATHRNFKPSKEMRALLDELDLAEMAPDFVRGAPQLAISEGAADYWRDAVSMIMDVVAVRPANWASRHPTWVQKYWSRVEDLLDMADPAVKDDILGVARNEAKLDRTSLSRLEAVKADGTLFAEDIHALAARYASDETKKLLYDLHNKGRFFDALRLVFPFGEAWREVFTTWGRLLTENPKSLRTLQKTLYGAESTGIVYKDQKTGEEMFTIPGTGALSGLVGVKGDFRASTGGLSIAGSVLPGVGPAVQWGVGTFLPDKPEFKVIRDIVFQFGGEDQGLVQTFAPGWAEKLQKWIGAPESDKQFNAAIGEALNAEASTGEYDLTNDKDIERLQDKAVSIARATFFWRGILQFVSPSAPQARQFVTTKKGNRVTPFLSERFWEMASQDYDGAVQRFVDDFGADALIATVPYTETSVGGKRVYGIRPSKEFGEFEAKHGKLFDLYPRVAGLFGPQTAGYDFQTYERQARSLRSPKSSVQRIEERNATLGQMAFARYKGKLPANPTGPQRKWLAQVKRELIESYPGFNPDDFNPGDVKKAITDLRRAADHDSLRDSDLAQTIQQYFKYRDKVIAAAPSTGWQTAGNSRHLREWLRTVADELGEQVPEFNAVWDQLLSTEMSDDLEEED